MNDIAYKENIPDTNGIRLPELEEVTKDVSDGEIKDFLDGAMNQDYQNQKKFVVPIEDRKEENE